LFHSFSAGPILWSRRTDPMQRGRDCLDLMQRLLEHGMYGRVAPVSTGRGKIRLSRGLVSGHDFSRADQARKMSRALAPANPSFAKLLSCGRRVPQGLDFGSVLQEF
jgi:hypothetical protein